MFALHVIEELNAAEARKRTKAAKVDKSKWSIDLFMKYAHGRINDAVRGGFSRVKGDLFAAYKMALNEDQLDSVAVRLRGKGYTVRKSRGGLNVSW